MAFSLTITDDLHAITISTFTTWLVFILPVLILVSLSNGHTVRYWSEIIVGGVASVANIGIVALHWTKAPHPKFIMSLKRKICIKMHVLGGTLEIFSSLIAILLGGVLSKDVTILGIIQGIGALINVVAAMFQTPIVFGRKAVIIPGYYYIELVHAFFAIETCLHPGSLRAIVNTYFAVNIFTYVRLFLVILIHNNVIPGSEYTMSCLIAPLVIVPFLIGPGAVFIILLAVACNGSLTRFLMGVDQYHPRYIAVITEHDRYTFYNKEMMDEWRGKSDGRSDEDHARDVFNTIDVSGNGLIEREELVDLLKRFNVKPAVMSAFIDLLNKNNDAINFDLFYQHLWKMNNFSRPNIKFSTVKDDREKAKLVFSSIDIDRSETISSLELTKLLSEWGCPDDEVVDYMKRYDENGDGIISFEEFFTKMKDLWSYGFERMLAEEKRQTKMQVEMIVTHDKNEHSTT